MANVTAAMFVGIVQFAQCMDGARMTTEGFDSNGDLLVDTANDPGAVAAIQDALLSLGYPVTTSGVYDNVTAENVRQFKIDQNLAVPPGLAAHDGVTGPGTAGRLNELFTDTPPPPVKDDELFYSDRKSHFTNVALDKAHFTAHPDWDPATGFTANRDQIVDVYAYYRDTYLAAPDTFLWAGLGRMAGGAVVGGLDRAHGLLDEVIMVRIGRDIFFDLAWQHEAFLADPALAVRLAGLHDRFNTYPAYDAFGNPQFVAGTPARSYGQAWTKISSGNPALVADGNRDLLENEQRSIIQPHYIRLRQFLFAGMPTPFTNAIHPYHRAFVVEMPGRDILNVDDRWAWISGNMWNNWVAAGTPERSRLVSLPFDRLCNGDFDVPGRPDLLPGGP